MRTDSLISAKDLPQRMCIMPLIGYQQSSALSRIQGLERFGDRMREHVTFLSAPPAM